MNFHDPVSRDINSLENRINEIQQLVGQKKLDDSEKKSTFNNARALRDERVLRSEKHQEKKPTQMRG